MSLAALETPSIPFGPALLSPTRQGTPTPLTPLVELHTGERGTEGPVDEPEADPTGMLIGGCESGSGEMAGGLEVIEIDDSEPEPEEEPEAEPKEEPEADIKPGSLPFSLSFLLSFSF